MSRSTDDYYARLRQELSAIPDSQPSTPRNAPQSKPHGQLTSSTQTTLSLSTGTSGAMIPVFLSQVITAAVRDILKSS